MKIRIIFDFHDIFVDAQKAWIIAFQESTGGIEAAQLYKTGVSKKDICKKYNLDYSNLERTYRAVLEPIPDRIEFARKLSNCYAIEIVSCSDYNRLLLDIEKVRLNSLFTTVVSCKPADKLHDYLMNESTQCDWLVYFNHEKQNIEVFENLIYVPIQFEGNLAWNDNVSFTEHAKKKLLYNELSPFYMESIANDTKKECDFIMKHMTENATNILDCCCGVGRHAISLANNGYFVTAFDISKRQIVTAKQIHAHPNIDYLIMDARNISLGNKIFDGAICMWTTYNYLSLNEELRGFIKGVATWLKPGGILLLDSKNIPALDQRRVYKRRREKDEIELELLICKRVIHNIQHSQYFYFFNKTKHDFYFDEEYVRFYSIEEIKRLSKPYFRVVEVYGDFDGSAYSKAASTRFIVKLERTEICI